MRVVECRAEDPFAILRKRTIVRDSTIERIVGEIIADVRERGDAALLDNARQFDAPGLSSILVSDEELSAARLPPREQRAISFAASRIRSYHQRQRQALHAGYLGGIPFAPDVGLGFGAGEGVGQRMIVLRSAGVYVPGGKANYPSSVLMNAVPAKAAGVSDVFVTTPAGSDGTLTPAVLAALREAEVTKAFKIGGAAAIAALAIGTESVPRVDKIVGPGNRFVNEAKRQLWGQVGLDGYAGPSEVCVLVDEHANAAWAAADLLTQVEHAEDNAGFLIALSRAKLDEVLAQVESQLQGAARESTMRTALGNGSLAFLARDLAQAIDIVNAIAPEHLTLAVKDPSAALARVQNAGCVLMGEHTPESAGDYCIGPSHTLPTGGSARFGSAVSVLDFLKLQSVSYFTPETLKPLIETVEVFGEMEGLPVHARGATIRIDPGS